MKKIYTLIAGIAMAGSMLAQLETVVQFDKSVKQIINPTIQARIKYQQSDCNAAFATKYQLLSPTQAVLFNNGGGAAGGKFGAFTSPVFPDSSLTYTSGSTVPKHLHTMKAGGLMDPTSQNFTPGSTGFDKFQSYILDSVYVSGFYNIKDPSGLAGDTLQMEVSWGPKSATYFKPLTYGTAPARYVLLPTDVVSTTSGNTSPDAAPSSNKKVLKYVLTKFDADTANPNYGTFIKSTGGINIPAGNVVSIQYTFIPKNPYTPNQDYFDYGTTNNALMNSFLAYVYVQSATGTPYLFYDSTYQATSLPSNQAYGAYSNKNRYGINTGANAVLNGALNPSFTAGWDWGMYVQFTPTGIVELSKYGVSLSQNMPNPFNGTTQIGYELANASDVVFSVYDITGRIVLENKLGMNNAGKHTIDLNAAEFSKGVYFYNIRANGASLSRKMIITE